MKIGDNIRVVGLLPFEKQGLYLKEGSIIHIDNYRAFPVAALIDGRIEYFTKEDVRVNIAI